MLNGSKASSQNAPADPCSGRAGCLRRLPARAPSSDADVDHVDGRTISDSRILPRKQGNQRLVLAQRDARKTPGAAIGCAGYAKACARDCGVVRPRIVLKGVEQPGQFGEQSLVRVLKLSTPMQRVG